MGWLFDLTDARGPVFAVLRGDEAEARHALAAHLADAGPVGDADEALALLAEVKPDAVAVVW